MAPARFAAVGSIGSARNVLLMLPSHCVGASLVSLVDPAAARSAVPKLFGAEPIGYATRGDRPCASQARLGLWGRHL